MNRRKLSTLEEDGKNDGHHQWSTPLTLKKDARPKMHNWQIEQLSL